MRSRGFRVLLAAGLISAASPLLAGFGSTVSYLAAVGRVSGAGGAQFYTTIWITNLTTAPQTFNFEFLKGGQANPSPASFQDTLQPGETKVYENVVETRLGLNDALGAARITSSGELFVAERIYNQAPGDDLGNTEGLFFAGVPKSFSISSGQSASIQGVDQGGAENFRYNFALIETGGGSPTVNVQVFDGLGALLGQKAYPLQPYEQIQPNVTDVVPNIATANARITATVTHGPGSVILAGAQLANESQDSSGFEMTFPDSILGQGNGGGGVTSLNGLTGALTLTAGNGISITPSGSQITVAFTGGGGSGLTAVTHDSSLSGAGTGASPLGIAAGEVVRSVNGLHDNLTLAAGSNVTITPNGSTLTIASSGLSLPFVGTSNSPGTAFSIVNSSTSVPSTGIAGRGVLGVEGDGTSIGVLGLGSGFNFFSLYANTGIEGLASTFGALGVAGNYSGYAAGGAGVWGDAKSVPGVLGTSDSQVGAYGHSNGSYGIQGVSENNDGVYGTSTSFNGVEGNVTNSSAGVAGVNHGSGPGIYGENQSGGYAGDFVGDVIVVGNLTYSGSLIHSSDARFKKDITPLTDALDAILRLRGVAFDWRREEFPDRRFPAGTSVGFIAQEVGKVLPALVSTDRQGYEGVDYAALTPILVEAIKAQQGTIDAQRRTIAGQQRSMDDLSMRLERLERERGIDPAASATEVMCRELDQPSGIAKSREDQ